MITTGVELALSLAENSRPRSCGIPMDRKYPGLTACTPTSGCWPRGNGARPSTSLGPVVVSSPSSGRSFEMATPSTLGSAAARGKKLLEKLRGAALGRVVRARKIHPHRDHVIGSEAGIDFKHPDKAAAKQPGANKKNQRESHFCNDENAAQAIVGETLGAATPGFL